MSDSVDITFRVRSTELFDLLAPLVQRVVDGASDAVVVSKSASSRADDDDAVATREKPTRKRRVTKDGAAKSGAKSSAKKAEIVDEDPFGLDDDDDDDAPQVTIDDVKLAIKAHVEARDTESAAGILAKFRAKKLSELKVEYYADVVKELLDF